MDVIITEWALQSYLDLKAKGIFTEQDYREILRPDAELLKTDDPFDANHPRFSNAKFWGPATHNKVRLQDEMAQLWSWSKPASIVYCDCDN